MTNNEYIQGVLRTESPVTSELLKRLSDRRVMFLFREMGYLASRSGVTLDAYKKFFFYGKRCSSTLDPSSIKCDMDADVLARLTPQVVRLLHGVLGMITEYAGELLPLLLDHIFEGKELDLVNFKEEVGDGFWYAGLLADDLGVSFEELMIQNNAKLKARYPDKFTEDKALNRDLDNERKVLEEKPTDQLDKIDEIIQDSELSKLSMEQLMSLVLHGKVSIIAAQRVMGLS